MQVIKKGCNIIATLQNNSFMQENKEKVEKLVIVGSGPAGLTAAIYGARGFLNPLVVTGRSAGGQLMLTTDVDDFPGFPQGIKGPALMELFRAQAERFGARILEEEVTQADFSGHPFKITTDNRAILTKAVIIATGASALWLGLPSEKQLIGRGVSACAVCDGPFFRGKKVVVVGGGDAAMREAQHLSKYASQVTIVHRREALKAQEALQQLVKKLPNVNFVYNSTVEEVLGKERVSGVRLKNTLTGKVSTLKTDGMFLAIGSRPNTQFLEGQINLDKKGYVEISDETKTSVPGVFVAGDVADWHYRQAVTAAGSGCKAALDAEHYLDHLDAATS